MRVFQKRHIYKYIIFVYIYICIFGMLATSRLIFSLFYFFILFLVFFQSVVMNFQQLFYLKQNYTFYRAKSGLNMSSFEGAFVKNTLAQICLVLREMKKNICQFMCCRTIKNIQFSAGKILSNKKVSIVFIETDVQVLLFFILFFTLFVEQIDLFSNCWNWFLYCL